MFGLDLHCKNVYFSNSHSDLWRHEIFIIFLKKFLPYFTCITAMLCLIAAWKFLPSLSTRVRNLLHLPAPAGKTGPLQSVQKKQKIEVWNLVACDSCLLLCHTGISKNVSAEEFSEFSNVQFQKQLRCNLGLIVQMNVKSFLKWNLFLSYFGCIPFLKFVENCFPNRISVSYLFFLFVSLSFFKKR